MPNQDALHDAIIRHGASSETLRLLLSDLKSRGNAKKLLQESLQAVRLYPQDPHLRRMLAESYFQAGFFSLAEAELKEVTAQIDELIPVYKLLADRYKKQNRVEEAIECLRIYLAHRPQDHEALDFFEALHTPAPIEEAPLEAAGEPAREEAPPAALQMPAEVHDETAFEEIATPTLAEVYVNQGEIAEALAIYQKVLARNPQDEKARQRIGELQVMIAPPETATPMKEGDWARRKKERAIAILEAWLTDLRRIYRESMTS